MNNNNSLALTSNNIETCDNYIIFIIKNKQYAINVQKIIEVINMPELEFPQGSPMGIAGILNYNGMMIKVIDLCPFLGFGHADFSINSQLIITVINEKFMAVLTDKIESISQINSGNLQSIPFEMENSPVKEIFYDGENSINIIDTESLYTILSTPDKQTGLVNYCELFPNDEKSLQIFKFRQKKNQIELNSFNFPLNINSIKQHILFTIENQHYYIDLKYVKEFVSVKRHKITKIPYTEKFVLGLINVKGNFIILLDLKCFLNNEPAEITENSKIIVVQGKTFDLAFLVDEIKYIKNLKNIQRNSGNFENSDYIDYEFIEDDILYNVLNLEKIMNDERIYINN